MRGVIYKYTFSLKEASNELNIPYQAIQRVLKGTRYKTRNLILNIIKSKKLYYLLTGAKNKQEKK